MLKAERGEPFTFPLGAGRGIPGGVIPPNASLGFDIELLEVATP